MYVFLLEAPIQCIVKIYIAAVMYCAVMYCAGMYCAVMKMNFATLPFYNSH